MLFADLSPALPIATARVAWYVTGELGGKLYDFAKLLPHGITQWGTASTNLLPPVGEFTTVVPFVGSAIKAG
jgi:hypothetical protein